MTTQGGGSADPAPTAAAQSGDCDTAVVWAGAAIDLIDSVEDAVKDSDTRQRVVDVVRRALDRTLAPPHSRQGQHDRDKYRDQLDGQPRLPLVAVV